MSAYIRVALRKSTQAFDQLYTYSDPFDCQVGQRVHLPFGRGNRDEQAFVVERLDEPWLAESLEPLTRPDPEKVKEISGRVEDTVWLQQEQLQLAAQLRLRYNCTWSQAIALMLPPLDLPKTTREQYYYLVDKEMAAQALAEDEITSVEQMAVVSVLQDYEGALQRSELMAAANVSDSPLRTLKSKGLVASCGKTQLPNHLKALVIEAQNQLPTIDEIPAIYRDRKVLNDEQINALETMLGASGEYLLHGVTGSGKTEVYLAYAEEIIARGGKLIVLVPEIALTAQMIQRFVAHFGHRIALWHSRLNPRERQTEWGRIKQGEVDIVLGARSAVFMPLPNLQAIILDEAHEPAFASEQTPRYHATTIARLRMKQGTLILGSATPSAEDYARSLTGKSRRLVLEERAGEAYEPVIKTIDLKRYIPGIYSDFISPPLLRALRECFERGEQAMLFLNRRGYASAYLCESCGEQMSCPRCSVQMNYHRSEERMVCHYCGLMLHPPHECPSCGEAALRLMGYGTQQIYERAKDLFPDIAIARMDQDSTRHRRAHEEILEAYRNEEIRLLIGTQMIAKGHDFPKLTVVGILGVDQMLNLGSFRAEERAYQLIMQAAGRAGRAERSGEVFVQAYDVGHPVVQEAAHGTFESFMTKELAWRETMQYPPYGAIGRVHLSGLHERAVAQAARTIYEKWKSVKLPTDLQAEAPHLMEPGPAPITMIKHRYRYFLTLKSPSEFLVTRFLKLAIQTHKDRDVRLTVELDPA